jgi:hypothetical protein
LRGLYIAFNKRSILKTQLIANITAWSNVGVNVTCVHSFTIFPTPIQRHHFDQVTQLQPRINELVHRIANSPHVLDANFASLMGVDHFVSSLCRIHKQSLAEGANQPITLSILRCDYMLHHSEKKRAIDQTAKTSMKQVEINTIAAGFGYVGMRATQLHRELIKWTNNTDILSRVRHPSHLSI